MKPAATQHLQSVSRRRRRLFRLAAVVLGLSLFAVFELVCVAFDWGRPTDFDDPFVGFSEIHPLFVPDEKGEVYITAASRQRFFAPDEFPVKKGPDTFRIFCLGGSTVQGRPYSIATSFTTWLELNLTAADASRKWEVVNCGGISYASYRLVPILEECLANYEPDLIIICSGHNEFLEERTYDHIKHAPKFISAVQRTLSKFRSYVLLREAVQNASGRAVEAEKKQLPEMTADANALLDYHDGLSAYHRDEEWRAGVISHYEHNIRRMVGLCRQAGVPVFLIRPPSNLSDCPPYKSEHRSDLSEAELSSWTGLFEDAQSHYRTNLDLSIELLKEALAIDDRYAVAWYELGQCYDAKRIREATRRDHWREQARQAFRRAREEDICPLRILEPMEQALAKVARDTDTPLIDAFELLQRKENSGILGGYMLVDHIHPSFQGHQMIADALAEEMVRQGWVHPEEGWEETRTSFYKLQMDRLDDLYYLHGQRMLEALMEWTKGRADGPSIEMRTPNGVVPEEP